ncbi:sugar kinase [Paraflavitalea sp. CAU 1676]|uniref:sugar kinase n=1 Tax=Paraflavitalea sp. CAU 1676 TaxID=3032598 RepID=UPI0023DB651D|nr:sugar kinase [Paraflavitalea sp. CAU 1676]MDF2189579.1 sugar kinase [Paraflavitalea sp. CAU 1676]
MKGTVFCFGELLLRMSPVLNREWIQTNTMPVYVGGAELNVATALARWGVPARYSTALPDNYLSKEICDEIRTKKIDTSAIHYSGNRVGLYYLPQGADMKNAGVIYDRAHSSFASLQPGMIDWDTVLKDVSWFHFSAISPALNENVVAVCEEGAAAASAKGITVSVDLNYRAKLWQYGKKPVEIMPRLAKYCDVIMGNIWAANSLLGISVDPEIHIDGKREDFLAHATKTSLAIQQAYPKCKTVANTFRFDAGDGGILYYAALYNGGQLYYTKELTAAKIIDKVGSGDCFMAGLIHGLYHGHDSQKVIDVAARAAFGKLMEKGDATSQEMSTIIAQLDK